MGQRIVIFANPIAGSGRGRVLAESLQRRFVARGWDAETCFDRPEEATNEVLRGATAAVSIGGDGTLRSVVERVTDHGRTEGPGVLVIPMGTANLMGKHLGLYGDFAGIEDRAVEAIAARRIALLDVGVVRATGEGSGFGVQGSAQAGEHGAHPPSAPPGPGAPVAMDNGQWTMDRPGQSAIRNRQSTISSPPRLFLLMVGVGMDGQIVHALHSVRKGPIGYLSYLLPAARTVAEWTFPEIEVEVDGQVVWPMGAGLAFVGNVPEYGTGFPLLPHARSDDGLLDVCVLRAESFEEMVQQSMGVLAGEHVFSEGTVYLKGKHVRVRSKRPVAVQADGDPAGWTPMEAELLPQRVAFFVGQ